MNSAQPCLYLSKIILSDNYKPRKQIIADSVYPTLAELITDISDFASATSDSYEDYVLNLNALLSENMPFLGYPNFSSYESNESERVFKEFLNLTKNPFSLGELTEMEMLDCVAQCYAIGLSLSDQQWYPVQEVVALENGKQTVGPHVALAKQFKDSFVLIDLVIHSQIETEEQKRSYHIRSKDNFLRSFKPVEFIPYLEQTQYQN